MHSQPSKTSWKIENFVPKDEEEVPAFMSANVLPAAAVATVTEEGGRTITDDDDDEDHLSKLCHDLFFDRHGLLPTMMTTAFDPEKVDFGADDDDPILSPSYTSLDIGADVEVGIDLTADLDINGVLESVISNCGALSPIPVLTEFSADPILTGGGPAFSQTLSSHSSPEAAAEKDALMPIPVFVKAPLEGLACVPTSDNDKPRPTVIAPVSAKVPGVTYVNGKPSVVVRLSLSLVRNCLNRNRSNMPADSAACAKPASVVAVRTTEKLQRNSVGSPTGGVRQKRKCSRRSSDGRQQSVTKCVLTSKVIKSSDYDRDKSVTECVSALANGVKDRKDGDSDRTDVRNTNKRKIEATNEDKCQKRSCDKDLRVEELENCTQLVCF